MTYEPQLDHDDQAGPARVYVWTCDALAADGLRNALVGEPSLICVPVLEEAHVMVWDAGSMAVQLDGAEVRSQLQRAQHAGQPVIALVPDADAAAHCLQLGARSALLRRIHAPSLTAAIVAARFGLCVCDAELAEAWLPAASAASDPDKPKRTLADGMGASALTAREHEVLALLALGLSNRQIAKRLTVSIHTVKFHVNSILAKLNVDTRTAAVSAALRGGWITL